MAIHQTSDESRAELVALVSAAQAGDRDAFGELFTRYHSQVLAIAMRRLRDHGEAQELAQEVFVKAMIKLDQLRTPVCFPAWLRSIARRMAINRVVRRSPVTATEPEIMDSHCVELKTPLGHVLDRERERQVHGGLDRLRALDRETLRAFYLQGQSLREMSDEFDAPLGTIKRRLHTARKRLSDELAGVQASH
jgi:RNA polymerase sigma-70 factor (ECF subfamily)